MWSCLPSVEEALWSATAEVVEVGALAPRRLREAIEERSRLYTSERERLQEPSDRAADLAARAVFYTVADAPKSSFVIAELDRRGLLGQRLRVLDLGAGCGAMTWGLLGCRAPRALDVLAIDRDRDALQILSRVARSLGVTVDTRAQEAGRLVGAESFDLVLVGSLLNELDQPQPVVASLLERLHDSGSLVIIEPALREQSRALHRLRDWILENRLAHVFAPCVRRAPGCPALDDERNWCHEDRPTELPPRARQLSVETSRRRQGMKFSYLVLTKQDQRQVDTEPAARVVSRVRKLKGKWEAFLCSERGREKVTLLKRDVDGGNRIFTDLERGDVVIGVDGPRVSKDSELVRVSLEGSDGDPLDG